MKALIELLDGSTTTRELYSATDVPPSVFHVSGVTYHHKGTIFPEGTPVYRVRHEAPDRSQQHKADHEGDHKPVDE